MENSRVVDFGDAQQSILLHKLLQKTCTADSAVRLSRQILRKYCRISTSSSACRMRKLEGFMK